MSSAASAQLFNDNFMGKFAEADGKQKMAEYGGTYIRDRLRELSFLGQIMPPTNVTKADCQRSVNHDTLVKILDVEPQSKAMVATFRDQAKVRILRGPRVECAFHTIMSEKFQKYEEELLAYEMPLTKIVEENSVKDMQEIIDLIFITHGEAAVQALQTEANGGSVTSLSASTLQGGTPPAEFSVRKGELARAASTDDATVRPLQKPDIVNLRKMLNRNRLKARQVLMTESEFDDVHQWTLEDIGDRIAGETTTDGYKYNQLVGLEYRRTIKTDILREGNVYVFTAPEYLGRYYVLNAPKFYIDKIANLIMFQSWMNVGMVIANVAAVRKMELYSGDATTLDASGILASVSPVAEDSLGAVNNRVDSGVRFPAINGLF